jgi:hypothetical protein
MRRRFCFALFLAGSLAVFACKEDEKRPPAASDIGQTTSSGSPSGGGSSGSNGEGGAVDSGDTGDAGSCNTLDNDGNVVDQNRIVGDPPTGTGGQIADGTWELTEAAIYVGASGTPGPSGVTYKGVLRLTLGKLERVTEQTANQGANPITTRTFGDLVAGGSTFTVTQSCPAPFQDQYTYSVLNNTLNITSLITKESFTFTLR